MICRTWKQRTALFICVFFLLPWFFQTADAAGYDRHGYTLLENDAQRYAYKTLVDEIGDCTAQIQLDDQKMVTINDLSTAMDMILTDYPEYFWINGAYSYAVPGGSEYVKHISPVYTLTGTALQTAKAKLETAVSQIIASIPASARSDYDKSLFLHDQLASLVSYQFTSNDQTAYGALVEKKCVCAGYSRAYQLLMNRAGIPCWYVRGNAVNSEGEVQAHGWNMVWLDGICCYTDVTWDDQGDTLFHAYFNISLEQISKTHIPDTPITAPCNHDTYSFFSKSAGKGVFDHTANTSIRDAANAFAVRSGTGKDVTLFCAIRYQGDDFIAWIREVQEELYDIYAFKGSYSYRYSAMGNEYQVTVNATVSQQIPSEEPTAPSTAPTTTPTTPPTTAPTTKPTTAPTTTPTTEPTTEPTTTPTEPITTPTEPTRPTEPTEPVEPVMPTVPTEPTEPVAPTESTVPASGADPAEGSIFNTPETTVPMTAENTDSTETNAPGATEVTGSSTSDTAPKPTQSKAEKDPEKQEPLLMVALAVVACGGVIVAVILIRKKHNA